MKKSFTLLATITFQNLFYASAFNDILSKEDNIEEHEKMWTLLKNHFRTKISITEAELKKYLEGKDLIEKNNEKKKKKQIKIPEETIQFVKDIENKAKKVELIDSLISIIDKSDILQKNKEKNIPFDSELMRNIILHGYKDENKILSKINVSDSIVTEMFQGLNFINPEDIIVKTNKIKEIYNSDSFTTLNDSFKILKDNEVDFINLFSQRQAWERFGGSFRNYYIEILKKINKTKSADVVDLLASEISGIVLATASGVACLCFTVFTCIRWLSLYIGIPLAILCGGAMALSICGAKICQKSLFNPKGFYDILTEKFRGIKTYVDTMKSIFKKIKSSPNLYELYKDNLKFSENLFERKENFSKDEMEMLNLLDLIPYDWKYGEKTGKVSAKKFCRFILLFDKCKDIFLKPLFEISNIGVDVNSVCLLKNNNKKNKWCIPSLIYQNLPFLNAKEVWSPVVGQDIAIPNDICFGINEKNGENSFINHMVLAGMNAGGKTTLLKSIASVLLLGQSLGICNASEVNMTPYDKIYCIIDVYSDPEKNFSEFQNQLYVSDRLCYLNNYSKLNRKKIFLVTDELLMGTNPRDYNIFMHKFAEEITSNDYLQSINAVHMSMLVDYANTHPDKHIYNYSMNTKVLGEKYGKELEYTYKVIPGVVDEKIAQALARQMYKDGKLKTRVFL